VDGHDRTLGERLANQIYVRKTVRAAEAVPDSEPERDNHRRQSL